MTDNSSRKPRTRKPALDKPPKPYKDFPLGAANCGSWQKRINGKLHYFGRWGTMKDGIMTRIQPDGCWHEALTLYKAQEADLFAGRRPRGAGASVKAGDDVLRIKDLCNRFLTAKQHKLDTGEIGSRAFQ